MPLPTLAQIAATVEAHLREGDIREGYIDHPQFFISGLCDGEKVTINPIPEKADTIIHEMLHKAYPTWSEAYVRKRTTTLVRHFGDEGIQRLCRVYDRRKKQQRRVTHVVELS